MLKKRLTLTPPLLPVRVRPTTFVNSHANQPTFLCLSAFGAPRAVALGPAKRRFGEVLNRAPPSVNRLTIKSVRLGAQGFYSYLCKRKPHEEGGDSATKGCITRPQRSSSRPHQHQLYQALANAAPARLRPAARNGSCL